MKLHEHAFRDLFHQFILLPIDKNDPHIPDFSKNSLITTMPTHSYSMVISTTKRGLHLKF